MNATPPRPSRSLRFLAAAVQWSLWLVLAASLLLALAWAGLHGFIVPRIGEFRPALENQATRALGLPVRIGGISARSEGLVPSFELRDVLLLDPQGREALRLPLVVASLSPRSLWNLGFDQLYVQAPQLAVRRSPEGRILVAGLDLSGGSDNEGRAADWFFRQGEFIVRGGTVEWIDELRGAPPLALRQLDLVVRNRGRRHAFRLEAAPPAEWGAPFSVTGRFQQPLLTAHPGRWQQWVGELHADFSEVDLSQLRRHADLGVVVDRGRGRLRAWADIERGQLVGGTADVALTGVHAVLGPGLAPLALRSVSGRVGGRRLAGGFEIHTRELQFLTEEGQRWPGGNFAVAWTAAEGAAQAAGELRADRLDLGALRQVASRLPLGATVHAALDTYAPEGLVETLQARWQGPLESPARYQAQGRVQQLSVRAGPAGAGAAGVPGVRGLSGQFELSQAGGTARVAVAAGALAFPGVFEQPEIPLETLSADLQWQLKGADIRVAVQNLRFANADMAGEARASWRTGDSAAPGGARFPGVLDLEGSLSRAAGTRVWRYLPLAVGGEARDYVRTAVRAGVATGASFRVQGDLREFPFDRGRGGTFRVSARVRDAVLAYVPGGVEPPWPALQRLAGELVFEGNGMQVRHASGRVAGWPRLQVEAEARIDDFNRTEVAVQGRVRGPLADALALVNHTPLAGLTGGALAGASGTGQAEVDLRLALPVHAIERSQVHGTVTLAGNDVQVTPATPLLTRARGAVLFSAQGFELAGVQARALGGELRLEGGSRPGGEVQLRAAGIATAEGLRQARELGFLARLARDLAGSAPYQLALGIRRGHPELLVTSSLQGMALNLPAPLAKSAEAVLPLRYETALTRESLLSGARLQEHLRVELGRLARVDYLRDLSGPEPQVVRGAIAVGLGPGETMPLPPRGVAANLQLARIDVQAWQRALDRLAGAELGPASAAGAATGYLPDVVALRARELALEGRTLHRLVVGGSREGPTWRANVIADELDGYVEYRQASRGREARLRARLARLKIAAATASEVESLLEEQPGSMPALDVVVDEFELKGHRLGRLEVAASNRAADDGVGEWRLERLALSTPEARFTASGNSVALHAQAAPGERRRTAMTFRLELADSGGLLARFGMPGLVRGGRGSMEGHVGWIGSPLAFDYPTLTGRFHVDLQSGHFLKAEPGLAKLLGVLSLQSLPRRLALDFSDVFSDGFSFDFMRGDVTIAQGIAATNNLQMKGVNAAVLMDGRADLARETQDLKVVVVPEINAGTASLVATVINPAVGLGSFLAQWFLREPLMKAATQEFHVDGSWGDPRVTRVGRNGVAAEPATR